jgi:hypothetical protein
MRLAVSVLVVALIAGCTAIPEQRIRAFGDAYGEMKTAAETVYANYSSEDVARRKEAFETKLAAASPSQYFDLIVPKALAEPVDRGQTPPAIATNALAALEAGTVYNAALLALASGKSVEEVQQSVTALSGTIGSLGGVPWIGPVIGIIVGQVEKARARGELVATLTREYTITLPEGETRTGHLMDLLLDLLIEHADLMFQKRREIALQRAELLEFEGETRAQPRSSQTTWPMTTRFWHSTGSFWSRPSNTSASCKTRRRTRHRTFRPRRPCRSPARSSPNHGWSWR